MTQEQTKEINRLKKTIERLESRTETKYLRKLEKENHRLEVVIKTHERNIEQKNRELVELATKVIQEESFSEKMDRKNKEMKQLLKEKRTEKK